ncbi:hypothetical protein PG993_015000 [Apiospora rasikravindrae]|uniref:Uncharacterized protein n=1 Tax=Apiospora rasikravindrae TaxID=990691 RepID=A0ABR1RPC7_9PEZI
MRPVPMRSLVSPLLSVSTESREAALKYYNVRLEVLRLPVMEFLDPSTDYLHWSLSLYRPRPTTWYEAYRTYPQLACTLSDNTWLLSEGLEAIGLSKGVLYMNLEKDRFFPFYSWYDAHVHNYRHSCSHPFNARGRNSAQAAGLGCGHTPRYSHVSSKLPQWAWQRITRVVYLHDGSHIKDLFTGWWGGGYDRDATAYHWMLKEFPRIASPSSQHLAIDASKQWPSADLFASFESCNIYPSLIEEVARRGAAHLDMERWEMRENGVYQV